MPRSPTVASWVQTTRETGGRVPQNLECGTLMQTVPQILLCFTTFSTKTRHFKCKIHFFVNRALAPSPDTYPGGKGKGYPFPTPQPSLHPCVHRILARFTPWYVGNICKIGGNVAYQINKTVQLLGALSLDPCFLAGARPRTPGRGSGLDPTESLATPPFSKSWLRCAQSQSASKLLKDLCQYKITSYFISFTSSMWIPKDLIFCKLKYSMTLCDKESQYNWERI